MGKAPRKQRSESKQKTCSRCGRTVSGNRRGNYTCPHCRRK